MGYLSAFQTEGWQNKLSLDVADSSALTHHERLSHTKSIFNLDALTHQVCSMSMPSVPVLLNNALPVLTHGVCVCVCVSKQV